MIAPALDIAGLRKRFVLHIRNGLILEALEGATFRVPRGEFTGLVGQSGSGKSTLLKCLFRTYLPDGGRALYRTASGDIVDLATANEHEILRLRRAGFAYVSQTLRVIPRVNVEKTVARPLIARSVEAGEATAAARYLLERLNLPQSLWDSYPALLSGGEQQRVNVARALISEPDLLLLDEPTSALDAVNQSAVVELLSERLAAGTTMVGAFHDAPSLRRLASQVIRLSAGEVIAIDANERESVLAGGFHA